MYEDSMPLVFAARRLPDESWELVTLADDPFRPRYRTAQRKVARDERITNSAHGRIMPPSWMTRAS